MTYEIVEKNFLKKLWNAQMVKKAVPIVITEEQFVEIMKKGLDKNIITEAAFQELTRK